jgi:TRAP-type C4-dicarboxylate transport system permease small subunit
MERDGGQGAQSFRAAAVKRLDRLIAGLTAVSRGGVWAGGVLLFAACFMIGIEVVGRKFFGFSFEGVDELSGYVLAIASAWAFGFTLISRTHVRIDTLYVALPRRAQLALDVLAMASIVGFFGFVAWFAWLLLHRSLLLSAKAMTPLQTPLAIPQAMWVAGLVLFVLIAALLLLRALIALAAGDATTATRLIGSRTQRQEVAEEIEAAQAILAREKAAP